MKSIRLVLAGFVMFTPVAMAVEKPSDLERLVRLELDLGLMKASGFGEKHPRVLKLVANIERIEKRNPGIRDGAYVTLLKTNRARLEDKQADAIDEGMGEKHPQQVELARQLAAIDQRMEAVRR